MAKLCEKCGKYDPTPELAADSRCPSCGVVYAGLSEPSGSEPAGSALSPSPASTTRSAAPPFAANEPASDWAALNPADFWLSVVGVGLLFAVIILDGDGFVLLLDHANLAFHEAGHLFFGLLGSTPGLYGGTLGQLVFPVVAFLSFRHRGQAVGAALGGVWLFENLLNIARYMADARAQRVPLVGSGEHDWYRIFSRWGVLDRDTAIASATQTLGWIGMIGCMLWLWRRFSAKQRAP